MSIQMWENSIVSTRNPSTWIRRTYRVHTGEYEEHLLLVQYPTPLVRTVPATIELRSNPVHDRTSGEGVGDLPQYEPDGVVPLLLHGNGLNLNIGGVRSKLLEFLGDIIEVLLSGRRSGASSLGQGIVDK